MLFSVWDYNQDKFVKFDYKPSDEDMEEYKDSLSNKDILTFIQPFCATSSGGFFNFLDKELELNYIKNKANVLDLYKNSPEEFRQLALKYLIDECKQKPLRDDMRDFFTTYAEAEYEKNNNK